MTATFFHPYPLLIKRTCMYTPTHMRKHFIMCACILIVKAK